VPALPQGSEGGRRRLARETVAGRRGKNKVEGVLSAPAVRRRVGERFADLQQLDVEPGQLCVMSSGRASRVCGEQMRANRMSSLSISVTNCGTALSLASILRQS